MTIVDALTSAPSEHAVYFLVTAYIESLRHFERTCGVPQRVIALPIEGSGDLNERLDALRHARTHPTETVVVSEVAAVLGAALGRLESLADHVPAPHSRAALSSARTDSPHSSLSV